MKRILKKTLFLGIALLAMKVWAQVGTWKTETTDNGKIVVKSNVSERIDASGNHVPLIAYIATTTEAMTLQNCINIMKDVSRHREFLDLKSSTKLETWSGNEWLNYYVFNAPWPFESSDCVARVSYSEDLKAKTVLFTMTAAPNLMKPSLMKRFTYYNFTYMFKDMGNGKVEASVSAKLSLTSNVPIWMLRSSLPSSAATPLRKLVKIIKEN